MSQRLKELREHNNLTQEKVAKILNITQQQYFRYENGSRELPLKYLKILKDFYNTSSDYIYGFTNEKMPYKK